MTKNPIIKTCTLLFLRKHDEILLAMKKRGLGAGYWNGAGGKLEPNETIQQALIRECQEEINVTPIDYSKIAEFDFINNAEVEPWHMHVYAYICTNWQGEPIETEEMAPQWFDLSAIPYEQMWADDQYWLPLVLAGDKVTGTFEFDSDNQLLSHSIKTVKELPND